MSCRRAFMDALAVGCSHGSIIDGDKTHCYQSPSERKTYRKGVEDHRADWQVREMGTKNVTLQIQKASNQRT